MTHPIQNPESPEATEVVNAGSGNTPEIEETVIGVGAGNAPAKAEEEN